MNNIKIYKILYYTSFILTLCLTIFDTYIWSAYYQMYPEGAPIDITLSPTIQLLGLPCLILFSIFNFQLIKRKLTKINIVAPICYIAFLIITIIIMFIYNDILIIPYIHLEYYTMLILFAYLLLNIYSILSTEKNKK